MPDPLFDPEQLDDEQPQPFDPEQLAAAPVSSTSQPLTYRQFLDVRAQRQAVFDRVQQAYQNKKLDFQGNRLEFADVQYRRPKEYTLREEKDAKLGRKRLYWALQGRLRLLDAEGKVVREDPKPRTLAQVPYMTRRGTFIHNGNEFVVSNQQRLRAGIYTRRQANGDVESQFNILPGTGRGFRVKMEPQTGVFRLQVGQSNMKLFPVLKDLGLTDKQLQETWGKEVYQANALADDKDERLTLPKLVAKLGGPNDSGLPPEEARTRLLQLFERMRLDPQTTRRTMGRPYEQVDSRTLLDATGRILRVNRQEEEEDERDDLPFQSFHGPEDFFAEHVDKDAQQLVRQAFWKFKNGRDVPDNYFTKQLQTVLTSSGLGSPIAEINPVEVLDARHKIIRLGEGGIGSTQGISRDARGVQPSHFGFIDPIRAPECYDSLTEVMTSCGWVPWPDVTKDTLFACQVEGRLEYHKADQLYRKAYRGPMYGGRSRFIEYLVTPNHRLYVRPQSGVKRDGSAYSPSYRFETPDKTCRTARLFNTAGHLPIDSTNTSFYLPTVTGGNAVKNLHKAIDIGDWCEFLGWYLAGGCFTAKAGHYTVSISQDPVSNYDNCEQLAELLSRLPFSWCYSDRCFTISGKQLTSYVSKFGKSDDKWIPDEVFSAPVGARRRFVDAILRGDGRRNRKGDLSCLCTSSVKLARDFQRLVFELGRSSRISFEPDDRQPQYLGCHIVHLHEVSERLLVRKSPRHPEGQYRTVDYEGEVFCATVPGGLLYVRRNNSCGFWCGNSANIGLDMRLAQGVVRGSDGLLYSQVVNPHTGEKQYLSSEQFLDSAVAFPGEFARAQKQLENPQDRPFGRKARKAWGKVRAMSGGQIRYLPADQVQYELPEGASLFTPGTNFVPLTANLKGQRLLMGARMQSQALPLEAPESPLVQSKALGSDRSINQELGREMGAVFADQPGAVKKVTPDEIVVQLQDGTTRSYDLYNSFPLNQKTSLHNTALVKPGQRIEPGQLLAKSNFTNDRGEVALGRNMRVAFHMMDGMTHEDAVVLSESGSQKFKSEQLYTQTLEKNDEIDQIRRDQFVSKYPQTFTADQLKTVDENGVVRPGTIVRQGDPLILAVGKKKTKVRGSLMRSQKSQFTDASETWDHEQPGQVMDTYKTGSGWRVSVRSYTPTRVGDKIANGYGGKGVVARVVPDSEMPIDSRGRPLEMAINPMGVISRVNPSQVIETALGKVAEVTGKPYVLPGFSDQHMAEFAMQELQKHGLSDTEDLTDPRTGEKIPQVFTGVQHFYKLHHLAESGLNARNQGAYTMDDQPAKGGYDGCFIGRQRILTINGWERISHLVEKQKRTPVRTWDAVSGEWLYRPITDWFTHRAKVEDVRVVEFVGPSLGDDKDWSLQAMTATINHEVYLSDGTSKLVGELVEGDCLATWGVLPTDHQWQLAVGTMLGDASCRTANGFTVEHSKKQVDYVNWKLRLFGSLGATFHDVDRAPSETSLAQNTRIRSRVVSVSSPAFVEALRSLCYDSAGKKTVTKEWVGQLTELGVCLWLLDDGYLTNKAKKAGKLKLEGGFCTYAFSVEERQLLCDRLSDIYGPHFRVTGGQVQFRKDGAKALIESVARYVPASVIPKSKAVLIRLISAIQEKTPPVDLSLSRTPGLYPARIRSIRPYVHDKPGISEINVYDITVDQTHKYCASSALVSNSKRIGLMELFGLLSHGATEVIRDSKMVRGQRNDDYWRLYRMGLNPPEPRVSRQYQKFEALLQGSGISLRKSGTKTQILPMTDADVQVLAGTREIENGKTVDFDSGEPHKGGLFDIGLTGGADGQKWSFIRLPEPLPNPVMEEPIKSMLGLTGPQFEKILSGEQELKGLTGGQAIKQALEKLDVKREIEQAKDEIRSGKKTKRDRAVKRLGYLTALERNEIRPQELLMERVPVVPPRFRPISRMEGTELVSDANYLYKELLEARENYHKAGQLFGTPGDTRLDLYQAFKGVTGMGQPLLKENQQRGLKGLLRQVLGESPKFGQFQRSVIGNPVDITGRAVIVPDPDYDVDEVGLPVEAAWDLYKPFIIRDLTRRGKSAVTAIRAYTDRLPDAREALKRVVDSRPLIINRAPSLHKHNLTAHRVRLVAGNALKLPIPILVGHNADFDGDKLNFHVPVSEKAVKEAWEKMMPSQSLYSPKDFRVHMLPSQGYIMGLYQGSTGDSGRPRRTFRSAEDVVEAYKKGEIGPTDPITVLRG